MASRTTLRKTAPPPAPVLFFENVHAYHRTAALMAALDLDLFTRIAQGAATTAELAAECRTSRRGLRILLDYLTIMGMLRKDARRGEGTYRLTEESAHFLDRRSPGSMAAAMNFLAEPRMKEIARDLAAAVRSGGTLMPDGGTTQREFAGWVEFARGMAPMMETPARFIAEMVAGASGGRSRVPFSGKAPTRSRPTPAGRIRVLDIAAGHGRFGIAIAERNPQAEITALDWPAVLEVAKENARAAGVLARYSTLAGSAFEVDFGGPYDVVLLTNFLHHFDRAVNTRLLRKVQTALKPEGRAVILEFVPHEDRVSPPPAASFALVMLLGTPAGDAYTFRELEGMLREAGFARARHHSIPGSPQTVVVGEKQSSAAARQSPAKPKK
jgi:SAM-dependent methyltransferase